MPQVAPLEEPAAASSPGSSTPGAISLSEYRTRLQSLDHLIAACQSAMTPANCQTSRVGPDVQVALPAGSRQIRFGWLRNLLDQAAGDQAVKERKAKEQREAKERAAKSSPPKSDKKQSPVPAAEIPDYNPPTLAQRLDDARKRLVEDEQLTQSASNAPEHPAAASSTPQRATLASILAAKEYRTAVAGRSLKQRILEKIGNWIDKVLASLIQAGAKSKWIGITAEIGFVLLVCTALIWFLIRLEKQGRFAPVTLRSRHWSRLRPRLAALAPGRSRGRHPRCLARRHSPALLGQHLPPRIPPSLARGPRPHPPRISRASHPRKSPTTRPERSHPQFRAHLVRRPSSL